MIHRVLLCLHMKVVDRIRLEFIPINENTQKEILLMVISKIPGSMIKQDLLLFVSNSIFKVLNQFLYKIMFGN